MRHNLRDSKGRFKSSKTWEFNLQETDTKGRVKVKYGLKFFDKEGIISRIEKILKRLKGEGK